MADQSEREGEPLGDDAPWEPWSPEDVASRLVSCGARWYVVAGWALDLFRGGQTRSHEDIEIGVPSSEFPKIRAALADFEFDVVGSGERLPLNQESMEAHFQTWVRDAATGIYHLDVFRDPHEGDTWICRRDHSIRMPFDDLVRHTPGGIPYMSPEVVLLFKAKHDRDKDRADLQGVLPLLDPSQVSWLRLNLEQVHPGHTWCDALG